MTFVLHLISGAGPELSLGGLSPMRRPAQLTGHAAPGWAHPYTGIAGLATFYNDGGQGDAPTDPPKPGPPPAASVDPSKQFSQDDLDRIAAKEKAQGQRAGARQALEDFAAEHGFSNVDDAKQFIEAARKAQQDALSEEEKRRQELERREAELATREAAAIARERAANRRAALVGLGATGDDLEDATALLRVADDADDQTVREAAEALKQRRPELFGTKPTPTPSTLPPAPGGSPAGGGPRQQATKDDVKARAEARALQMGFRRDAA